MLHARSQPQFGGDRKPRRRSHEAPELSSVDIYQRADRPGTGSTRVSPLRRRASASSLVLYAGTGDDPAHDKGHFFCPRVGLAIAWISARLSQDQETGRGFASPIALRRRTADRAETADNRVAPMSVQDPSSHCWRCRPYLRRSAATHSRFRRACKCFSITDLHGRPA